VAALVAGVGNNKWSRRKLEDKQPHGKGSIENVAGKDELCDWGRPGAGSIVRCWR